MIRNLSETLRAILTQPVLPPELANAHILFDRPSEPFSPVPPATVNLFLCDIRENVELRSNEPVVERINGQALIRKPPLRVACSYLVTAWPVDGSDLALQEHRLLSQVLIVLSRYPTIPAEFLQGSLVGQEPLLPMMTAQADGLKNPAEFWTALGNKMRPSFTVTVTIAMDVFVPETVPLVITGDVRLELWGLPASREEFFRIGGRVTDAANAPVANAAVTLVERGLVTTTNAAGRFNLGPVMPGNYTLRVQFGAAVKEVNITIPAPVGKDYNLKLT